MLTREDVLCAWASAVEAEEECTVEDHVGCDCSVNGGDLVQEIGVLLARQSDPNDGPENDLRIGMFMHCGMCLSELPSNTSPRDYARLSVGWTPRGFQVWCNRHEVNVCHVDFEGVQHKANTTRPAQPVKP